MHYHNGTTGSEQKYDRWGEAQDRQFEHAKFADVKERFASPKNYAEADRLAEMVRNAYAAQFSLGEMCFSLTKCRDRAVEKGLSDVVLAVQPLVDKYNELLKVARDAYAEAVSASATFNVKEWQ
jgi:hypothetical protein